MKKISKLLGYVSLWVLFLMPFAYFFDLVGFTAMTGAMLASTVVWYLTAFFWIGDPQVPNLEEDPLL
ncbi:MAG TPA: hypothetical protein DCY38_04810 [Opitutae bacterium]|jgi:hypothetical protein|nr:hypothetical protein [Opitutae bacterium]